MSGNETGFKSKTSVHSKTLLVSHHMKEFAVASTGIGNTEEICGDFHSFSQYSQSASKKSETSGAF